MTRRDREILEIADWAERYSASERDVLDALYAADCDGDDLDDVLREVEHRSDSEAR